MCMASQQGWQDQRKPLLCNPRGALGGLGAGGCLGQTPSCYPVTYSVTVGRRVVLPGCLSLSLPKATGLGGERLSLE